MRTTDFHLFTETDGNRVRVHGDYMYHGIRFEFTLNEQAESSSPQKGSSKKRKKYRGQITVISPNDGHPMSFSVRHPYAKSKEKQKTKVKHRELSSDSRSTKEVKERVRKAAQSIYSDNALLFMRLVKSTIRPGTVHPELAGDLYAEEYIRFRRSNNTEDTLKKKLKKLVEAISELPDKPMSEITPVEVREALKNRPKVDISLVSDFWNYCILNHYCEGKNPVVAPASESASASSKQKRLQMLTRVPKQNLQILNRMLLENPSGPNCGIALMESHVSAQAACAMLWKNIRWPTTDPSFAIGEFGRPDVMCAIHNFSRPLLPLTALVLHARREALSERFSQEELAEMSVVSTKSNPCKPMQPSALVQESKRLLLQSGIDQNKLLQAKESRGDPVSARILAETYKDLLLRPCGVEEGSGTQKFLCGMAINNDVTSTNYVSFSDPVGLRRLWKYLRVTAPRQIYDETLQCYTDDGSDSFRVKPGTSELCAGMLIDIILQPGQEILLKAESGFSGTVSATLLEEDAAMNEQPDAEETC